MSPTTHGPNPSAEPNPTLLAMLRLTTSESHRLFWNAGRASEDHNAFGVFPVREWGGLKCYGLTLDSSNMSPEALHSTARDMFASRVREFCSMTGNDWADYRQRVLANEGLPWSNDQSYAIEDLQTWMQYRVPAAPAKSLRSAASTLEKNRVCQWLQGTDNNFDTGAAVDVVVQHSLPP